MILIDYGHEARELYSATHSGGTLTTFSRHTSAGPGAPQRRAAVAATTRASRTSPRTSTSPASARRQKPKGCTTLGFLDQTYFLLALGRRSTVRRWSLRQRLALKTLLMPGGLGSTMKVLILGKGVGHAGARRVLVPYGA